MVSLEDTGEIGQSLSQKNSLGIESLTDRQKMIVNLMRKEMGNKRKGGIVRVF